MLRVNDPAPNFECINQANQPVSLSEFKGKKNVIVYFYPKDDTPGCTIEANQFTALMPEFDRFDTLVFGVSKDDCDSHQSFIDKFGLKVELLADTDGALCEQFGVWQEKEKNGEKRMGIVRSTFVVDKQGVLKEVIYGVNPEGHAQAMLDKVKQL